MTDKTLSQQNNKMSSINSSLSSSCSSSSYSIKTNNTHPTSADYERENDSGIEKDDLNTIFVRVSINDQSLQKVLKFNLDESVWLAKQRVLANLAKEVKDGLNYGFYLPPYQGRAGKFLDDCRKLKEYSLHGPVAQLEFKYKKRVYKFVKINQKELKALNVKSNYKKFLDVVRTNQIQKACRLLDKGLDPNFHSDLGETPLTLSVSLAEPRGMIMTLYNGGAHLDFRSRDTLTAMHKAAIIGNDKALKTLLELGAFAEVRDGRMLTPLYYSILNRSSIQSVEYLLFNGSTIGVKDDNNWEEIHHVCKLGLSQHLDHLIYYGCDLNSKNTSGNTPLHICAIHNQENCARILLFRGCNRNERNLSNQSPYDSAVISNNQTLADLIKNHRDLDTVPIKDRPFYNTKRRSVYIHETQSIQSESSSLCQRACSMPKLDDLSSNSLYAVTSTTLIGISNINHGPSTPPPPPPPLGSRLSSPSSRSRSISSDEQSNIEYAYPRKRLYPSIPNRKFITIKAYKPSQPGELELRKGDVVELLSVGDSGFWEGRSVGGEGWFKASCVEEFIDSNQSDTVVVKRKTLFDLITNNDLEAPRTVVLQKGKKGFGFVLRGAKTCDGRFEPSLDCPALQFLESVDKESNAEKAGLKQLDFVLEINGVDVTCKTHLECVKLIKKTGDTLAMKVYTSKNFSDFTSSFANLNLNLNLTSTCVYQSPLIYSDTAMVKSQSYYAASSIATKNMAARTCNEYHSHTDKDLDEIYFDGTKSLPNKNKNKKKPIPPKRDPSTSLSRTNLPKSCKKRFSMNNDTLTYMNSFMAQIDELDKTLAEYDTSQTHDLNSSFASSTNKTKLLANDANAASIRTRVPVRKPGINNGEIFIQKTLSVPNLYQQASPNIPPPPPPPTVPSIPHTTHSSKNRTMSQPPVNIYSSPTSLQNDTLVQADYDCEDDSNCNYSQQIEPVVDYDQTEDQLAKTPLSTFNSNKNSQILMMVNKTVQSTSNTSSPLTPRQIKQRNTAKRNSLSLASLTSNCNSISLTQAQLDDLAFLQTQKFDADFIQTTRDLFSHYPNAKISISVTLTSIQNSSQTQTRQIEIDRFMFDKLLSSTQTHTKIQPQTPVRTTSVLTNNYHSCSSSSPSSGSTSSSSSTSAYDTGLLLNEPSLTVKNELERALENRLRRLSTNMVQSTNSFPPPPSPTALHRLSKIDGRESPKIGNNERFSSPPPPPPPPPPAFFSNEGVQINKSNNVRSIVNSYQLLDPRSSSDFGELIAKKAAEKRAKFVEVKPVPSAVTYQTNGVKRTGLSEAQIMSTLNNVKKTLVNNTNKSSNALLNNGDCNLRQIGIMNQNQNQTQNQTANRNESFINTASRLLEKAKQHQHGSNLSVDETDSAKRPVLNGKLSTSSQKLNNSSLIPIK